MAHDFSRLGLGSVQWGLKYGIANQSGQTPKSEVTQILLAAEKKGIRYIDTASLYGQSEQVLGEHDLSNFNVVTKTPRLKNFSSADQAVSELASAIDQSLTYLNQKSVYGLLIHHADDLLGGSGEHVVSALKSLKSNGKVKKIGVSFYDSVQVKKVLDLFTPDLVQVPLNVLDQRMVIDGTLAQLKKLGTEVHARSAFLQGLLLLSPDHTSQYFEPIRPLLNNWHKQVIEQGMNPIQAALSFVRSIPQVDAVIVGVESIVQFEEIAKAFSSADSFSPKNLECNDIRFINPANWNIQ